MFGDLRVSISEYHRLLNVAIAVICEQSCITVGGKTLARSCSFPELPKTYECIFPKVMQMIDSMRGRLHSAHAIHGIDYRR